MASEHERRDGDSLRVTYGRDTLEFSRIANLFDAVFAIAMTLLVLNLEVPDMANEGLATALAGQIPQLLAFILSFALVANIWWQHHKLFDLLGSVEPVMVSINLVLLGLAVLVPYATGLIGRAYSQRAAVLPFIALFMLINLCIILLTLRAHKIRAWRRPVSVGFLTWLLGNYVGGIAILGVAFILAIWYPTAGLGVVAAATILGRLAALLSYME